MNTDYRLFPYIMEDIVTATAAQYDTVNWVTPYYHFGTYLELTKSIVIKDQIDAEKYPLVWLVWEAGENAQKWDSGKGYEVSPRLFICTFTSSDYSSVERYDANFVQILFPIWDIMKAKIQRSSFISNNGFTFQLAEHLLWGESLGFAKGQNVLFDTLDAIEIKIDSLKINKKC
jgi:hypothetical protein